MTKSEIITKTFAEMNQFCEEKVVAEPDFNDEPDYEELVIATLRDRLPDDDVKTCEDFEGLKVECCETCHRFYPHYDMSLENLSKGGKALICCSVRAALFSPLDSPRV